MRGGHLAVLGSDLGVLHYTATDSLGVSGSALLSGMPTGVTLRALDLAARVTQCGLGGCRRGMKGFRRPGTWHGLLKRGESGLYGIDEGRDPDND